jgi:hypothetical protein
MGLYCFVCCKYVGNICTSWYHGFFCFPLFSSAVAEFRVCVLSTCLCVCIHTRVCVCIHTHVYTVCTCGGMCACKCMYWSTHTHIQARIHVYARMHVRPAHRGMTRPSYAADRGHASACFRVVRAHGHGACAAAGGRDCRRQCRGKGRPTL